jgi:hypothetical protein
MTTTPDHIWCSLIRTNSEYTSIDWQSEDCTMPKQYTADGHAGRGGKSPRILNSILGGYQLPASCSGWKTPGIRYAGERGDKLWRSEVDAKDLWSSPVAGFGKSGSEPSGYVWFDLCALVHRLHVGSHRIQHPPPPSLKCLRWHKKTQVI